MELDNQLAALAAGELDDATARALRARVAADPALSRRLRHFEALHRLLDDWDAPTMPEEAAARLEARLDEALAALEDGPLVVPQATADRQPNRSGGDRERSTTGIFDLGRARRRREPSATGGVLAWPSWGPAAAVAAVLVAIVGTGILLGSLPGVGGLDTIAQDDAGEEAAEDTADSAAEESAGASSLEREEEAFSGEAADGPANQLAAGPLRSSGVDIAEGDLLVLLDVTTSATTANRGGAADQAPQGDDEAAADDDAGDGTLGACVVEALDRDTAQGDDRDLWALADGTYAGSTASFVVVRTSVTDGEDLFEVLAYDPATCALLARDETTR